MPGLFDNQGGPEFSLMGMLLGGRGYAANWFQQRDQMQWAQAAQAAQDAAEAEYGASLMTRPDYQKFRDNPTDRAAGLDFWAGTRGAPGDIDQDIAGYVATGIGAIYQQQQATLSGQIQRENAAYASGLEREQIDYRNKTGLELYKAEQDYAHGLNRTEIDYRNEKELKLYQDKVAFDAQRQEAMIKQLEGVPGEVAQNMRFDLQFPGVRQPNQSVNVGPDGGLYMRPSTGSAEHTKMMTQLTAGQAMIDQITDMSTALERGDFNAPSYKSAQAGLMMTAKSMFESGALDADSLAVMEAMIPKLGYLSDPGASSRALEAMRATVLMLQRRNADVAASFSTPISDLPKERQDKKYFPTPRGEPPAEGSVKKATEKVNTLPPPKQPDYGRPYDSGQGVFQ